MRVPFVPPWLQVVAGLLVVAALALAQLVIVLLHHWPSSVALWYLYFEFARRLDGVYGLLRAAVALDAVDFIALVVLAIGLIGIARRMPVRLLEALLLHAVLGCAVMVLLENLGLWRRPGLLRMEVEAGPGLIVVLLLFAPCAFVLAAACWRLHRDYMKRAGEEVGALRTGRVSRRSGAGGLALTSP